MFHAARSAVHDYRTYKRRTRASRSQAEALLHHLHLDLGGTRVLELGPGAGSALDVFSSHGATVDSSSEIPSSPPNAFAAATAAGASITCVGENGSRGPLTSFRREDPLRRGASPTPETSGTGSAISKVATLFSVRGSMNRPQVGSHRHSKRRAAAAPDGSRATACLISTRTCGSAESTPDR